MLVSRCQVHVLVTAYPVHIGTCITAYYQRQDTSDMLPFILSRRINHMVNPLFFQIKESVVNNLTGLCMCYDGPEIILTCHWKGT